MYLLRYLVNVIFFSCVLQNGVLVFLVDYGDGHVDKYRLRPLNGRLDDGEWHDVYITRRGRHVTITVDGRENPLRDLAGDTSINSGTVFLGGSADNGKLTDGIIRKNFEGIIETVRAQSIFNHLN